MKICHKCGAHNSDDNFFCVDCSEKLGDGLSYAQEEILSDAIDEKIEKLYNKTDPLYVDRFDKIIGLISAIGIALLLIVAVTGFFTKRETSFWGLGILFFIFAMLDALLPQISWTFEKIRVSMWAHGADELEPNSFYRISRKISILLLAAIGMVYLIITLLLFRHPPIVKYISDIANTSSIAFSSNTYDYIEANPEKWEIIINEGDYTVSTFVGELNASNKTGLQEHLMIAAIMEITDKSYTYTDKDDFLLQYKMDSIEREVSPGGEISYIQQGEG